MLDPVYFEADRCLHARWITAKSFPDFDQLYPFDGPTYVHIGRILRQAPPLVMAEIMYLQSIINVVSYGV